MTRNVFPPGAEDQDEKNQSWKRSREFKQWLNLELLLCKRPRKTICEDMEISEPLLSDWTNDKLLVLPPPWRLIGWTREVGPGLIRRVLREAGRYDVVDLDRADPPVRVTSGTQLVGLIAKHQGHLTAVSLQALEDGVIEDHERDGVYPEIQRVIRELESLAENFRPLTKADRRHVVGGES